MDISVKNYSQIDMMKYRDIICSLVKYASEQMGFQEGVDIVFIRDTENSRNPLGKTAYYLPSEGEIAVYVTDRHIKDILRSLSHELVHHKQNCEGRLQKGESGPGYAQKDNHLREMEKEAYELGNMIFRDFEDKIKTGNTKNREMKRLSQRLDDRFGFEFQV